MVSADFPHQRRTSIWDAYSVSWNSWLIKTHSFAASELHTRSMLRASSGLRPPRSDLSSVKSADKMRLVSSLKASGTRMSS